METHVKLTKLKTERPQKTLKDTHVETHHKSLPDEEKTLENPHMEVHNKDLPEDVVSEHAEEDGKPEEAEEASVEADEESKSSAEFAPAQSVVAKPKHVDGEAASEEMPDEA